MVKCPRCGNEDSSQILNPSGKYICVKCGFEWGNWAEFINELA
jgi:predicted RNA-binding Zn-ribbon protein involved in translation (DUF1610 family)